MSKMASSAVAQEKTAGQELVVATFRLDDFPVETIIEVLCYLDFETLDNMVSVNRRFKKIIETHWASIFPTTIERDFSPTDGFYEVLQEIIFPDQSVSNTGSGFGGLFPLINFCRVIKRWEAEFPRLRFSEAPDQSRSLRPHEICRMRDALYIWWRYGRYFDNPWPRLDNGPEARRVFFRRFSTSQLHEVLDFWRTVHHAVARRVCPSFTEVQGFLGKSATKEEVDRIGWGDEVDSEYIAETMMKLGPEDILHLVLYRHRYATKTSVIQVIRMRHPRIEENLYTFHGPIVDVGEERRVTFFPSPGFPDAHGGILDHEDHDNGERLRAFYSGDAGRGWNVYPSARRDMDRLTAVRVGRLDPSA
ncbi:hypothetical protein VTI74DRAFT_6619 [Chaetomium olivicolor]